MPSSREVGPTYWVDLFTHESWLEFHAAGAKVSGFRENRWNTISKMRPGDVLLCYLTGISRWIGLLEVTGAAFRSDDRIWSSSSLSSSMPFLRTAAWLTCEVEVTISWRAT